jgi:hypothetical protein
MKRHLFQSLIEVGLGDVRPPARLNVQVIANEGHGHPLRGQQLVDRMHGWLPGEYEAALGTIDETPGARCAVAPSPAQHYF